MILKAYEAQAAKVPAATMNLVVAFEQTNAWQAFLQPIDAKAASFGPGATSLTEARRNFTR
jgi:hypothetical protein